MIESVQAIANLRDILQAGTRHRRHPHRRRRPRARSWASRASTTYPTVAEAKHEVVAHLQGVQRPGRPPPRRRRQRRGGPRGGLPLPDAVGRPQLRVVEQGKTAGGSSLGPQPKTKFSEPLNGQRIIFAAVVLIERIEKDLRVSGAQGKESHRGAELQVIRAAKDLVRS